MHIYKEQGFKIYKPHDDLLRTNQNINKQDTQS